MSIIAVKKDKQYVTFVSDTQVTQGWNKSNKDNIKLTKVGQVIVGSAGKVKTAKLFILFLSEVQPGILETELDVIRLFRNFESWLVDNKVGKDIDLADNDFLINFKDKVFKVEDGYLISEVENFDAIGSGYDKALMGLELGFDIQKVVRIVCKFDLYCSEPIKVIKRKL